MGGLDAAKSLSRLKVTASRSDRNNLIALYLLAEFLKLIPIRLIRHKDTEIVVTGNRTRVRMPDLLILTEVIKSLDKS